MDRKTERLEKAQRIALKTWIGIGVRKPTEGQMARAILLVLEDVDRLPDPGWPKEDSDG